MDIVGNLHSLQFRIPQARKKLIMVVSYALITTPIQPRKGLVTFLIWVCVSLKAKSLEYSE